MKAPTRSKVIERANEDPLIAAILTWWRMGEITWEQAMMIVVLELVEQYEILQKELKRKHETIRK